ncbi:MAG: 4'-phosphopantetheinyl transferase superfamily protein [Pseudomonadota bacterium]
MSEAPCAIAGAALAAIGVSVWAMPLCERAPLTLFAARFDCHRFRSEWFRDEAIGCPEHIARSVRKRQAEFFYGRVCARAALRHAGIGELAVGVGAAREPVWPAGAVGSITHSRTVAAALVLPASRFAGVGIDIEEPIADAALGSMLETVVSAPELARMRALHAPLDLQAALTLVFSAKESFFKAAYGTVQRYFDFHAVEVVGFDAGARTITFEVAETLCERFCAGQVFRVRYAFLGDGQVITGFVW